MKGKTMASAALHVSSPPPRRLPALAAIDADDTNFVIWRRTLASEVVTYATQLAKNKLSLRHGTGHHLTAAELSARSELPPGDGREAWVADVAHALEQFSSFTGGQAFHVSIDVVTGDKCRRFHVDYYQLRWVSTYLGPTTEWVADADVVAEVFDGSIRCHDTFNRALVPDPSRVQRLSPGDVLLMKGRGWPGPQHGFGGPIHRSPPIEATGERRVVLTLTLQ
ncbi:MAG: DUF1826 domain-containing protein [Myxococcota bacterium]